MPKRPDPFVNAPVQSELFALHKNIRLATQPTPEIVREKMQGIIEQLQIAEHMPWLGEKARRNAVIFPQMANWLPPEEGERLCAVFNQELIRLGYPSKNEE